MLLAASYTLPLAPWPDAVLDAASAPAAAAAAVGVLKHTTLPLRTASAKRWITALCWAVLLAAESSAQYQSSLPTAVYSSRIIPRPISTAGTMLLLMLNAGRTAAAPETVLLDRRGALIGSAGELSLYTGSGAGGGGAGGANFMFWRQPQPPKKIPLATTSPQTSASTTSSVWFALSLTARFRGDSQCNCGNRTKRQIDTTDKPLSVARAR